MAVRSERTILREPTYRTLYVLLRDLLSEAGKLETEHLEVAEDYGIPLGGAGSASGSVGSCWSFLTLLPGIPVTIEICNLYLMFFRPVSRLLVTAVLVHYDAVWTYLLL